MKRYKICLMVVLLGFLGVFCFTSCSCEFGTQNPNSGTNPETEITYYEVSVNIVDNMGGSVTCSTDESLYSQGSSPVFTISPLLGYGIYNVTYDGVAYFSAPLGEYRAEPLTLTIPSIASNHIISVEFRRMFYSITTSIDRSSIYSAQDGGTILTNLGESISTYMGLVDASVEVRPSEGCCVKWVKVDGETYFEFNPSDSRSFDGLNIPFDSISASHLVETMFVRVVENLKFVSHHTYKHDQNGNNNVVSLLENDNVSAQVSIDGFSDGKFPSGDSCYLSITQKQGYILDKIGVSLDNGANFTFIENLNEDFEGVGFSYDKETKKIFVNHLMSSFVIDVYTKGFQVNISLYDYDNGEFFENYLAGEFLSYFIIDESLAEYFLYYSASKTAYTEPNTYHEIEKVLNDDVYSFQIVENMLVGDTNEIIIIYSQSQLSIN